MSEPTGFREYVAARQAALLRSAKLLTGDWPAAEDLVQTALVRVWPRWARVTADGTDPDAYVRRVMINTYLTWRRRRWWGERPTGSVPDRATGDDSLARVDLRDVLGRALRDLTPAQRAVVVLRFYEDQSVEQTAELLGCSTGTVKSQAAKALARLRSVVTVREIR